MAFLQRLPSQLCVLTKNDKSAPGLCLFHAMDLSPMLVQAYDPSPRPRVHVDVKYHGFVVEICHQAVSSSWVISNKPTNT